MGGAFMTGAGVAIYGASKKYYPSESKYDDVYYTRNRTMSKVALMVMGAIWQWAVLDAPIRASVINSRYNLVDGTIFENDDIGVQLKPFLATQSLNPGFDFNTAFPVYGAKLTLTLK